MLLTDQRNVLPNLEGNIRRNAFSGESLGEGGGEGPSEGGGGDGRCAKPTAVAEIHIFQLLLKSL